MKMFRLLLLTALACHFVRDPACVRAQVVPVGGIARNFTLTHHKTGQTLRLSDYSGSIIVLDFFAYWCGPCQVSSPEIEKNIAQYYAARKGNPYGVPVVVIGVNVESRSPADTDKFIANAGIGLAADDNRNEAWNQFNTEDAIPLFVIINGHGKSSNRKPWEVLYSDAGFSRTATIPKLRELIDQVKVVDGTPPVPNQAPTITVIADQATCKASPTSVIPFTVGDTETPTAALSVTAASSNKTVVPDSSIFLGGSGPNRTVFINPRAGQEGITTITVTVADAGTTGSAPKTASRSFKVTVGLNRLPTISIIPNQFVLPGKSTPAIAFSVGDSETPAALLSIRLRSSNPSLVPDSGIILAGTGPNRTVVVSPASGQIGVSTITLTVADGCNQSARTSFTVTVAPPATNRGDLNGDGQTDLLFQTDDGYLGAWFMNGRARTSASYLIPNYPNDSRWRGVVSADFNGDRQEDLVFQDAEGTLVIWLMNGITKTSGSYLNPRNPGDPNWRAVAAADLNNDAKADLLFQHADGTLAVWHMNGFNSISAGLIDPANPGDPNWRLVGTGDFNADGNYDLLLQHADGRVAVWFLSGRKMIRGELVNPLTPGDPQWRALSAVDRNRDSKPDLLFHHSGDGTLAIWFMDGTRMTSATLLNPAAPGGTWKVIPQ